MHKQLSKKLVINVGSLKTSLYAIIILLYVGHGQGDYAIYYSIFKILFVPRYYIGAVTISPSGLVLVCTRDQLELICTNVTGNRLEWRINVTSVASNRIYRHGITSEDGTDAQTRHLIINTSMLIFSRISNENEIPLASRLLINPVSDSLNGTEVTCEDVIFSSESTSTRIIAQASAEIQGKIDLLH